jgi:GDPmannose 4,6-dehydratase
VRALITGASGQDGVLLSRLLVAEGTRVVGVVRDHAARHRLSQLVPGAESVVADITDREAMASLLESLAPHEVYNLAAFSSVGRSWAEVDAVLHTNVVAVAGLLEAVLAQHRRGRPIRFYQASSSEVYGLSQEQPQTETTAHHPRSPYAVSKSAAQSLTMNYRESYDVYACSGVLYNHESPLRPRSFVTRKITAGVAEIVRGRSDRLVLGTLTVSRDWGWAPDYVQAMRAMLTLPSPRDYVIATGVAHSLRDFLDSAFRAAGVSDWDDLVESDPSLVRPAEVAGLVGDASAARRDLGWSPTVGFDELIHRMVAHDVGMLDGTTTEMGWLGRWPADPQ